MNLNSYLTYDSIRDLLNDDQDEDCSAPLDGGEDRIGYTFNIDSQHDSDVDFESSDNEIEDNESNAHPPIWTLP